MTTNTHQRIGSFLPLEDQYQQALVTRNYTFFRDDVEGYLASIWCENLAGVLHFIKGAKTYPLIMTTIFLKRVKVFDWVLDNNGLDLSFLDQLPNTEQYVLIKSKHRLEILRYLINNAKSSFSDSLLSYSNRIDPIFPKEALNKLTESELLILLGDSPSFQYHHGDKTPERVRKVLLDIYATPTFLTLEEQVVKKQIELYGKKTTFEEDKQELQTIYPEDPVMVLLCLPVGKIVGSCGYSLGELKQILPNLFTIIFVSHLTDPDGRFGELNTIRWQLHDQKNKQLAMNHLNTVQLIDRYNTVLNEDIPRIIELNYQQFLEDSASFTLTKRNSEEGEELVFRTNEYDPEWSDALDGSAFPFIFIGWEGVIAPASVEITSHPQIKATAQYYTELFILGYRLMKYKLTGQLDPLGTFYNYDEITPLISREREELAVCFDVRIDRRRHEEEFKFNTYCRYAHLVARETEKFASEWTVDQPIPRFYPWESLNIFQETGIAFPAFPAQQYRESFKYPVEFYNALKEQGWFFRTSYCPCLRYGPFELLLGVMDGLLLWIFADLPFEYMKGNEWRRLLYEREESHFDLTMLLSKSDFGFDPKKYDVLDVGNLDDIHYSRSYGITDIILLYNMYLFHQNNPHSRTTHDFLNHNFGNSLHLRMLPDLNKEEQEDPDWVEREETWDRDQGEGYDSDPEEDDL